MEVLTDRELAAVVLHEHGHARAWLYTLASTLVYTLWLATAAGIAVLVSILGLTAIVYTATAVLLAAAMTLPAMLVNWVAEHEADAEAAERVGLEATVSALVKLHIYGAIEDHLRLVKRIEIRDPRNILEETPKLTFTEVLYTLFTRNWRLPLHALDILRHPAYYTHPPLQLRIARLAHVTRP